MDRPQTICVACALLLAAAVRPACASGSEWEDIRLLLKSRVDAMKTIGLVAGVIDESGRHVVTYGRPARVSRKELDGDTVFEIGSITKVFTSLLLADMIERGEVKADDPVAKFLPESVKIPGRNGKEITLLSLSMQISGLPRLPDNLHPTDWTNPYADYGVAQLYEFLSGHTLRRDPGEKYEYSNLGVGLLGHALALHAGMSYEDLVRQRILGPLEMTSTSITLTASQRHRLAVGHDRSLRPVNNWDIPTLAGAGALRSTANDMLRFLAANLELVRTPLTPAIERMRSVRRDTGVHDLEIAMAWHILARDGRDLLWHNGGTGGYRSFVGFVPAKKKGVIVLSNTIMNTDDVGMQILGEKPPERHGKKR